MRVTVAHDYYSNLLREASFLKYQSHTLAVSRHVRAEVRVHEHVGAWKHRCQQHVDGHTWVARSEPTGVAHGIVALDVWDVAQER